MDLYPESEAALEQAGRAIADTWTATDFESLVPLYVGGDLEPVEALAMRVWLAHHPERGADIEAALAARQVLLRSSSACSADGIDLWPGIRAALQAEGWIGAAQAASQAASQAAAREGASLPAGPRAMRRYAASAAAAAAALLFTGGLAWLLGLGGLAEGIRGSGAPGDGPHPGAVATTAGARQAIVAESSAQGYPAVGHRAVGRALAGTAPDVRLVAHPELPPGVVRLGQSEGPRLEDHDHALDVDLGNYYPGSVFPIGRPAPSNASAVGGVEGTGNVFHLPPRRR